MKTFKDSPPAPLRGQGVVLALTHCPPPAAVPDGGDGMRADWSTSGKISDGLRVKHGSALTWFFLHVNSFFLTFAFTARGGRGSGLGSF